MTTRRSAAFWAMAAFFAVSLVFRIWASEPTWVQWDENYYLNIAQSFALRGELTPYMWRLGQSNLIAGSGTGYGVIALNLWLNAVGYSLFWGRLLMVACGVTAAALMYRVARAWWNSPEAGMAALIVALVAPSAFYTMMLRMDALAMLVYVLLLWLHLYALRSGRKWLHFALALTAVAAFEVHVFSAFYAAAFALYYAIDYGRVVWRERRVVLDTPAVYFGVGALLAGTVYLAIHVLPDPATYFLISRGCDECGEGILVSLPKRIVRFVLMRPFETILLTAAVVSALMKRRSTDWHYLILLAGWLAAEAIIGPPPNHLYFNHRWPLIALGAGGLAVNAAEGRLHRWLRPVGLSVAVIVLGLNLYMHLADMRPMWDAKNLEPSQAVAYIRANVPASTVIMARADKFYALQEYVAFLSYRDEGTRARMALRKETALELWRNIAPEVVFVEPKFFAQDSELQQFLREGGFQQVYPDLWIAPGASGP